MWEELEQQYATQVEFITIDRDTDAGDAFARSHGIAYQPGFVVFDSSGELTYADLGPYDEDELRDLVRSVAQEEEG